MPRQRFDMGSKWLLHNQGKGALLVGGFTDVRRIEAMPGEIVQNRKYPDGLLRVYLGNERKPHHVLIEVATYAEERALRQALDDLTLSYSALGHLPELLMLVLRPKGRFRISGQHAVRSKLGLSRLAVEWRTIELWTLPAEQFLVQADVGVAPWVPLMEFNGPPEVLLERCADKIQREAHPKDRTDLLVVSQVLTQLRFPDPELLKLLGGQPTMFESPLLQKWLAERLHEAIREVLKARFGTVPRDVNRLLREILDERKLTKLNVLAAKCPNIEAFREALLS
ncbi:MAG TPA: hypothetical protein VMG10_26865 [Gemmataceae bacterium]|nr:hypothetical protein [Gemmataceae bacterium]